MTLLRRSDRFSSVGVSVAGGVAHNLGQILMAMLLLGTARLAYYFPILVLTGVAGGIFTGLTAALLVKRIPEFK